MPDPGALTGQSSRREKLIGMLTARDGYHGINLARPVAEVAIDVIAHDVMVELENAYHGQNPLDMHPADFVTKRYELPGHEGLRYG